MGSPKTFRENIARLDSAKRARLAFLISRILGPLPLICILWLVVAVKSGIGFWKAIWVYPVIFVFVIAFPVLVTTYLVVTKRVSGIEWKNISERKKYMPSIAFISLVLLNFLTYILTNPTTFHLGLLLSAVMFTMILFWIFNKKISGHMVISVVTFSGINLYFHLQFLWLFLLIIPTFWARYTLNVHSLKQLVAGILMPLLFILVGIILLCCPGFQ